MSSDPQARQLTDTFVRSVLADVETALTERSADWMAALEQTRAEECRAETEAQAVAAAERAAATEAREQALRTEHAAALEDARAAGQAEVARLDAAHAAELTRIQAEHDLALAALRDEVSRLGDAAVVARDTHEAELAATLAAHRAQLDRLREQHRDEFEALCEAHRRELAAMPAPRAADTATTVPDEVTDLEAAAPAAHRVLTLVGTEWFRQHAQPEGTPDDTQGHGMEDPDADNAVPAAIEAPLGDDELRTAAVAHVHQWAGEAPPPIVVDLDGSSHDAWTFDSEAPVAVAMPEPAMSDDAPGEVDSATSADRATEAVPDQPAAQRIAEAAPEDVAAEALAEDGPGASPEAGTAADAPEVSARPRPRALERMRDAMAQLDGATSLKDTLDRLSDALAQHVPRSMVFIVRGDWLRGWRFNGFGEEAPAADSIVLAIEHTGDFRPVIEQGLRADVHPSRFAGAMHALSFACGDGEAAGVAVPVRLTGKTVAVLYADEGDPGGTTGGGTAEAVEILARHASRCLEAMTATRSVAALGARGGRTAAEASGQSATAAVPASVPATPAPPPTPEAIAAAERFATIVVGEIKLYNDAAITMGRRKRDLRTRLHAEIDRAQGLFTERMGSLPGHEEIFERELVRVLAAGDAALLGKPHAEAV